MRGDVMIVMIMVMVVLIAGMGGGTHAMMTDGKQVGRRRGELGWGGV